MAALGELVKMARLRAGLTARELGRSVGLSHSYVPQLEAGNIRAPSPRVLRELSRALPSLDYPALLVSAGYITSADELGPDTAGEYGAKTRDEYGAKTRSGREIAPRELGDSARKRGDGVRKSRAQKPRAGGPGARIPMLGAIPAGASAVSQVADLEELDAFHAPSGLTGTGPFAALAVRGNSMAGAGILDGDTVIVDRGAEIRDGDICAVRIAGDDPTLKRVVFERDVVVLEPANPDVRPIVVRRDEIGRSLEIFGRVVHLYRSL